MSEMSQVERTAMMAASRVWDPTILQSDAISGFEAGFIAGRDYGRERERTLTIALDRIASGEGDAMGIASDALGHANV